MEGMVFRSPSGRLPSGGTVLVADSEFLSSHRILAVESRGAEMLDPPALSRIESERNLKAKRGWTIAAVGGGSSAALVEFFPRGDTAILTFVLITPHGDAFEDYPGSVEKTSSRWRVDDEGSPDPGAFSVVAAFDSSGTIMLARTWAGPEGETATLLRADGSRLVPCVESYRYWAPN